MVQAGNVASESESEFESFIRGASVSELEEEVRAHEHTSIKQI
jgi:hypothetical protein